MERRVKLLSLLERWKELEEELIKQKLFQEEAALKSIKRERYALEKELKEVVKEIESKKSFTATELIEKLYAKEQIKGLIKEARHREEKKQEELKTIKEKLGEIHKKKRLFGRLKERFLAVYEEEKFKRFMKELDDLAIIQKVREAQDEA